MSNKPHAAVYAALKDWTNTPMQSKRYAHLMRNANTLRETLPEIKGLGQLYGMLRHELDHERRKSVLSRVAGRLITLEGDNLREQVKRMERPDQSTRAAS